jgi:PAS domain S-box-containing protein
MPLSPENTLFDAFKSPCLVLDIDAPLFTILKANEAYLAATGTTIPGLIGRPVFEVYPENDDTQRSSGKVTLIASFNKVIETKKTDTIEMLKYDIPIEGTNRFEAKYWRVENIPIFNKSGGLLAILNQVLDITSNILQAEYIDQLYENTDEGFLTVNRDLILVGFNRKFKEDYKKVFGKEVVAGTSIIEYASADRKELVKQVYERVFNGETITADMPFAFPDGVTRTFHFAYKPARNSFGDINGAFVSLSDVTEQKKLENNRREVLLNLQERNKELLCLYQVSSITLTETDTSKIIQKVAHIMPAGFLNPVETHVRIMFNNDVYTSKDFNETEYKIRSTRKKSRTGSILIEVFCENPQQLKLNELFLKEEEKLVQTISETLVLKLDQLMALSEIEHKSNQLQNVMNSSLDVVCTINIDGEFVMMSDACEQLWGYTPNELIGKKYMDFVFVEDHELTIETASDIISGVSKTNFENRYVHKNGALVPIVWSARWDEADQMMYCIARDATEKQAIESAIKAERERYAEVLMQAPAFICILSGENHVFEMTNPMYLELVDREDIIGKTIYEVFPEVKDQGFFEIIENVYNTGVPFFGNEILVKLKKGPQKVLTDVFINISFQAYKGPNNETRGVFVFGTDVTENIKTQHKISRLNEELSQHAENLKHTNEELEQFAYIASHDLQEPLRMVTSFLAQLERRYDDKLDEKGKQYIYFAVDGARRMRQIILDLLEYSRAGRLDNKREHAAISELIHNSLKMLGTTIFEKKAEITIGEMPVLPVSPIAIQQVFQNLIGNSIKYSREDEKPVITIRSKEFETHWKFTVSDNGIGIPEEYQDRIFQMFQRLHTRDEYSGTGIGLSICKRIIEQHKGIIGVKKNKNGGSDFYFTLSK